MGIDVVLRTKNSAETSPVFQRCLRAIKREIPLNRLIVADNSDPDSKTLAMIEIADFSQVKYLYAAGNRAEATQCAIAKVETEWFLVVDDDVILGPQWFTYAVEYLAPDWEAGMVWGWPRTMTRPVRNRKRVMELLTKKTEYEYCVRMFQHRGGLHDTLIRTDAVRGVQIPPDLQVYEDWFLMRTVIARGFYVLYPPAVWCYHYPNMEYSVEGMTLLGRLNKKYGLYHPKAMLFRLGMALPKAALILLITGDRPAALDQLKYYVYEALGFLRTRIQRPPHRDVSPFPKYRRAYDFRKKRFVEVKEGE